VAEEAAGVAFRMRRAGLLLLAYAAAASDVCWRGLKQRCVSCCSDGCCSSCSPSSRCWGAAVRSGKAARYRSAAASLRSSSERCLLERVVAALLMLLLSGSEEVNQYGIDIGLLCGGRMLRVALAVVVTRWRCWLRPLPSAACIESSCWAD
jgi:hypothetical protein